METTSDIVHVAGASPRSTRFDDFFFPDGAGLEAAHYIFLQGSGLLSHLSNREHWRVAELGFGTGLNFFALLAHWQKHASPQQRLSFTSVEGFPLPAKVIEESLSGFPEIKNVVAEFLQQYIALPRGVHRFLFCHGRVQLFLLVHEVSEAVRLLRPEQHCWFLDGFAPARNPDMWSEVVLQSVAEYSAPGALLSTWSAAGEVRRKLERCGFHIEKFPGFQGKRESMRGVYRGESTHPSGRQETVAHVAVVGAGLAGCSVVAECVRAGLAVTLFDEAPCAGAAASGNTAGLLYPHIGLQRTDAQGRVTHSTVTQDQGVQSSLYSGGFLETLRGLRRGEGKEASFSECGASFAARSKRLQRVFEECSSEDAGESVLFSPHPTYPDLFEIPHATVLDVRSYTRALGACASWVPARVTHTESNGGELLLHYCQTGDGQPRTRAFDAVFLCTSFALERMAPHLHGLLEPIRGEVFLLEMPTPIPKALCFGGYALPVPCGEYGKNLVMLGSTYDHHRLGLGSRMTDLPALLEQAATIFPEVPWQAGRVIGSRVSFRASPADKLPLYGQLEPKVFYLAGLGSRGVSSARILAQDLLARVLGEQPLLLNQHHAALSANRFSKTTINEQAQLFLRSRLGQR